MNYYYDQLCGALGLLKQNGADLPWKGLNDTLRSVAREHGPYNCDTDEIIALHRQYRKECINLGLIRIGELFRLDDARPLI